MTTTQLFDAWDTAFAELCAAYDKPATNERRAAYRKSFGKMHIAAWQAIVDHCLSPKGPEKFPTTHALWDLIRELRRVNVPEKPREEGQQFSRWAIAANKILFQLAYLDERREFKPIAKYPPMPEGGYGLPLPANTPKPIDDTLLRKVLAMKADYVRMAEEAEAQGSPWNTTEFRDLVYDGFEAVLL